MWTQPPPIVLPRHLPILLRTRKAPPSVLLMTNIACGVTSFSNSGDSSGSYSDVCIGRTGCGNVAAVIHKMTSIDSLLEFQNATEVRGGFTVFIINSSSLPLLMLSIRENLSIHEERCASPLKTSGTRSRKPSSTSTTSPF